MLNLFKRIVKYNGVKYVFKSKAQEREWWQNYLLEEVK